MNFSQALELLKQFKKVARPCYQDEYLFGYDSDRHNILRGKKVDGGMILVGQLSISSVDILADDWVEVKE